MAFEICRIESSSCKKGGCLVDPLQSQSHIWCAPACCRNHRFPLKNTAHLAQISSQSPPPQEVVLNQIRNSTAVVLCVISWYGTKTYQSLNDAIIDGPHIYIRSSEQGPEPETSAEAEELNAAYLVTNGIRTKWCISNRNWHECASNNSAARAEELQIVGDHWKSHKLAHVCMNAAACHC